MIVCVPFIVFRSILMLHHLILQGLLLLALNTIAKSAKDNTIQFYFDQNWHNNLAVLLARTLCKVLPCKSAVSATVI